MNVITDRNDYYNCVGLSSLYYMGVSSMWVCPPSPLQIFDAFTPRLTDSNVKVNLHALQSFSRLVPLLGDHLSPVLPNVLPALPITSKLAGIAPMAGKTLQLVCQYVDPAHLVQPLTNLSQFTNPKAQPIVVSRLAGR